MQKSRLYFGLMSGTSLDGLDTALVDFDSTVCRLLDTAYQPFPAELRGQLKTLCSEKSIDAHLLGQMDAQLALLYAGSVNTMLRKNALTAADITAIGCHGQTIRHNPPPAKNPFTWQIGDPNIIAEQTGVTTVADFRRRDLAAGGQAAPLAPAFHAYAFHSNDENRVVLNLGGIANITVLPATGEVRGFDTGPGNGLMNIWTQHHFQQAYDENGRIASKGKPLALLKEMLADEYFNRQPPKSTGPEYFNLHWVQRFLKTEKFDPTDVLATLNQLTAASVAHAVNRFAPTTNRILVCGGGVHNLFLMEQLAKYLPDCTVESTQKQNLHPDFIEAVAFAWLAKQTLEHRTGNLPSVTGADKAVILGGVYYAE